MKSAEEVLREFRNRNQQLMSEFDRIMELEKLILSQMTSDRTIEELYYLDRMCTCCEAIAQEILVKADALSDEMRSNISKMLEGPL